MRDYNRNEVERPRLNLVRGADGRLRSAGDPARNGLRETRQAPLHSPAPAINSDVRPLEGSGQQPNLTNDPAEAHGPGLVQQAGAVFREQHSRQKKRARFQFPKISMPHVSIPKIKIKMGRKYALGVVSVAAVMVLGTAGYHWLGHEEAPPSQSAQNTGVLDAADAQEPQFDAVLPQGKNIEDLGGWVRVSPADKAPVFAYVDRVGDVQLNVSQQLLPESLRVNTSKRIAELAEGFAANEKLIADDGTEAYIGTSIRGPQSVILAKNGLLILIKSSSKLTNDQWIEYIRLLH